MMRYQTTTKHCGALLFVTLHTSSIDAKFDVIGQTPQPTSCEEQYFRKENKARTKEKNEDLVPGPGRDVPFSLSLPRWRFPSGCSLSAGRRRYQAERASGTESRTRKGQRSSHDASTYPQSKSQTLKPPQSKNSKPTKHNRARIWDATASHGAVVPSVPSCPAALAV